MNNLIKQMNKIKSELSIENDYQTTEAIDYVIQKLEEQKLKHNEYSKTYYKKHNEQLKEYHKEYQKKKPYIMTDEQKQRYKEYQKQYYHNKRLNAKASKNDLKDESNALACSL